MDLEGIMFSEISDREKQILCVITDMWNLKKIKQRNEYNKTGKDSQNKLVVISRE